MLFPEPDCPTTARVEPAATCSEKSVKTCARAAGQPACAVELCGRGRVSIQLVVTHRHIAGWVCETDVSELDFSAQVRQLLPCTRSRVSDVSDDRADYQWVVASVGSRVSRGCTWTLGVNQRHPVQDRKDVLNGRFGFPDVWKRGLRIGNGECQQEYGEENLCWQSPQSTH